MGFRRRVASSTSTVVVLLVIVMVLLNLLSEAEGLWLSLPASRGAKCVSEEIQTCVVVLSDYTVFYEDHSHATPTISVKVTSPFGDNIYHKENVSTGQIAFTTTNSGSYLVCFWLDGANKDVEASVNLDWKTGIAAKDWESVAKRENIDGVQLELKKLEGAVQAIHENMLYLKNREAHMREVSERTNTRVAWFSVMSVGICIAVSAWQVSHLKNFFHKKKLI